MHTKGQECMKVLKRVDEDLSSLNGKATRRKAELVALEKTVQKQDEKMLKLMGRIDSALEQIDELEDLAETWDRRIRNLEEKVEELESKTCRCKGKEREVSEIRSFLSIFLTSNSFFPRTLILLTHVLTFAMISPHVLSPLFHFAFTIHTKPEPLRTSVRSIRRDYRRQELSTRKALRQAPSPIRSRIARHR